MQLQLAAQQQQQQQANAGVGSVQELYANGYVDSAAASAANAQKQMSNSRDRQSTADYRCVD